MSTIDLSVTKYALSIIRASILIIQRRSDGPGSRMDGQSDRDSIVLLRLLMILYRGEGCTIC